MEKYINEKISILPLSKLIIEYYANLYYCEKHGYHLSKFCLESKCLNARNHQGFSYELKNIKESQIRICGHCSNQSIYFPMDTNDIERMYVKEVNKYLYFDLGKSTKNYYKITRCDKCHHGKEKENEDNVGQEEEDNVLYGSNCLNGEHASGKLKSNVPIKISICCYDHRWYICFFQNLLTK